MNSLFPCGSLSGCSRAFLPGCSAQRAAVGQPAQAQGRLQSPLACCRGTKGGRGQTNPHPQAELPGTAQAPVPAEEPQALCAVAGPGD